jgi:membrane-associated phospholipid phosphatase
MLVVSDFDLSSTRFLNHFAGKSSLLDQTIQLLSDTFILHGILFVTLLWFVWFKDKREESRARFLMGSIGTALTGPLSRLLQIALSVHSRPLFNPELKLTIPVRINPDTWSHANSLPSDHAALFFALATLIWTRSRPLGIFAFCWAAITISTRIYLGVHYLSDILTGAALGILMVVLSQLIPPPAIIYRLLDWERYAPSSFYAISFIASYQVGTLFNDLRSIGSVISHLLLGHSV